VTQWEFNHFPNLRHLLAAAAHIIVADVIKPFFVFTLDWITFAVNHRVGGDDAVRRRICFDDLEFDRVHGRADKEQVTLLDRTVGFEKVWLQVDIKQISRNAFNRIVEGENVDAFAVRDIAGGGDRDHVGQPDAKVLADHLVHSHGGIVTGLIR
jgi:hypothetical protein